MFFLGFKCFKGWWIDGTPTLTVTTIQQGRQVGKSCINQSGVHQNATFCWALKYWETMSCKCPSNFSKIVKTPGRQFISDLCPPLYVFPNSIAYGPPMVYHFFFLARSKWNMGRSIKPVTESWLKRYWRRDQVKGHLKPIFVAISHARHAFKVRVFRPWTLSLGNHILQQDWTWDKLGCKRDWRWFVMKNYAIWSCDPIYLQCLPPLAPKNRWDELVGLQAAFARMEIQI